MIVDIVNIVNIVYDIYALHNKKNCFHLGIYFWETPTLHPKRLAWTSQPQGRRRDLRLQGWVPVTHQEDAAKIENMLEVSIILMHLKAEISNTSSSRNFCSTQPVCSQSRSRRNAAVARVKLCTKSQPLKPPSTASWDALCEAETQLTVPMQLYRPNSSTTSFPVKTTSWSSWILKVAGSFDGLTTLPWLPKVSLSIYITVKYRSWSMLGVRKCTSRLRISASSKQRLGAMDHRLWCMV